LLTKALWAPQGNKGVTSKKLLFVLFVVHMSDL